MDLVHAQYSISRASWREVFMVSITWSILVTLTTIPTAWYFQVTFGSNRLSLILPGHFYRWSPISVSTSCLLLPCPDFWNLFPTGTSFLPFWYNGQSKATLIQWSIKGNKKSIVGVYPILFFLEWILVLLLTVQVRLYLVANPVECIQDTGRENGEREGK